MAAVPFRMLVKMDGLGGRRAGIMCQRCGSGRDVRVYEIAGHLAILDWMCAVIVLATLTDPDWDNTHA